MARKKEELNPAQQLYLARKAADRGQCPDDDQFREQFPHLWSLLTTWWLDPVNRIEPARLQVQIVSGEWLFKLTSPSMSGHKAVTVPQWGAGLRELEIAVADPARPWMFWLKRSAKVAKIEPGKNPIAGLDDA